MQIGKGDKKTNPIDEKDLAAICVEAISSTNAIYKPGGRMIYTRRQITDLIQRAIAPGKKVRTVPMGVVKAFLPLMKIIAGNLMTKSLFL